MKLFHRKNATLLILGYGVLLLLVQCSANCKFKDTYYLEDACNGSSFMSIAENLITSHVLITDSCSRLGTSNVPLKKFFDFIIVGAGVAGPILAARLSENPNWDILLIEAGPEEPSISAVPGLLAYTWGSDLDWKFTTEPTEGQPTACLSKEGKCFWPRGKMVGGSGAMNGMMYMRGHPAIFDEWKKLGNPGWSYSEVEKYFLKAENPVNPELKKFTIHSNISNGNPLIIDLFRHKPKFADEVLKAAEKLNYKTKNLFPSKDPGVMIAPALTYGGLRGTTSRYYLRPAKKNKNLYVLTEAIVTKVLLNNKAAYGVEVIDSKNQKQIFTVKKEVILSAGAIGSPHLLLLSGIGPREDLKKLNIPVVQDLPVGKNLQNHVGVGIGFTINDTDYSPLTMKTLNEYIEKQTGPLSSTGLTQMTAFFTTNLTENGIPDIQSFFDGYYCGCVKTGLDKECSNGKVGNCPTRNINARITAVTTKSKGYLKLKSKNPLDKPLLYPNYFVEKRDLEILVEGIKKILEFKNTPTMKKWDMKWSTDRHPKCKQYKLNTDNYWKCLIKMETGPENHQVGTCRMGPANSPDSVVDPKLRVYGIKNLRVADASIMPVITNANTMGPVIMIAEKASDMIKDTYSSTWANKLVTNTIQPNKPGYTINWDNQPAGKLDSPVIPTQVIKANVWFKYYTKN